LTLAVVPAYGPDHASIYDDLYAGRGKDYPAESAQVAAEITARNPAATSLLDVGCGTGHHLTYLRRRFGDVSGVEPSPSMRAAATSRLDGISVTDGSMETLATGRTYDAVICLFSVIGYATSLATAIGRMASHLNAHGVLVVEPWLFPDRYEVGHVGSDFTTTDRRTIFRMSHSGLADGASVLTMNYLVGDTTGIKHFTDVHVLALHTRAEYERAFADAGCTVEYLTPGFGRGLFLGGRRPAVRSPGPAT
jgi:dTDP-3-amino-3,4,6-trideoxy-alpha-D-glucopyranose N,N-dimethyltransferase